MGYTTEFEGRITVTPPLSAEEVAYLKRFNHTRRMRWKQGPYYVDSKALFGQDWNNPDVIDANEPAEGQPGLWCKWVPTDDGAAIEWDGGEKFYNAEAWMEYLIEHFVGSDPVAKRADPERFGFLQGHTCNGVILAQGEEPSDRWTLVVRDNQVEVLDDHQPGVLETAASEGDASP